MGIEGADVEGAGAGVESAGAGAEERWARYLAGLPPPAWLGRREPDDARTRQALWAVLQFGVERRMVLFGGLAIDLALRAAGRPPLYSDDELPDYDWLAEDSVRAAYDLAERLQRLGFRQVAAIRAIHVQTMRVRTDFRYVADVGYMGGLLARVPQLEVGAPDPRAPGGGPAARVRVVHPDYQRIDMHLAFCFPYKGAPREDVFHRWGKDAERLERLDEAYPLFGRAGAPELPAAAAAGPVAEPAGWVRTREPVAGARPAELEVAFTGAAGYALLWEALRAMPGGGVEGLPPLARLAVRADGYRLGVAPGLEEVPAVASPREELFEGAEERCAPLLDLYALRRVAGLPGARGAYVGPQRLAAGALAAGPGGRWLRLASYHHVLLCFLAGAVWGPEGGRAACRRAAAWTAELVRRGRQAALALGGEALLAESPFAPPTSTVGERSLDPAYVIRISALAERAGDPPPFGPPAPVPANYYGSAPGGRQAGRPAGRGGKKPPPFDYAASEYFQHTGQCPGEPGAADGAPSSSEASSSEASGSEAASDAEDAEGAEGAGPGGATAAP